jgi:hypothetical protein
MVLASEWKNPPVNPFYKPFFVVAFFTGMRRGNAGIEMGQRFLRS